MKRTGFISRIRSVMMVVALLATSVIGAVAATPSPSMAETWSCDCLKTNVSVDGVAFPGKPIWMKFDWTNDSDRIWTDAQMSVTFPEGVEFEWAGWANENYDPATRTLTGTPRFSDNGVLSNTVHPWMQAYEWFQVTFDDSLAGTRVNIRNKASFVSPQGIPNSNMNGLYVDVLEKPIDFDYRTETRFTPDSTNWSGTATLTSKVYNDGPGNGGSVYAEITIDEELTVTSPLPEGCSKEDSWWGGSYYKCERLAPDGGFGPGLLTSWAFTVQAPAASDWDYFEAETDLGCSTSGVAGSDELDSDNNSDSAVLTVPASPAGLLAVVRNLPAYIDEPGVITNPTAGRSMSSSVDLFNAGDATITGPISVTIDPTPGFTPTSISATSEDSTAPAPSCDLATLTCTFSQLGDSLRARITIVGDLAPTITHGTVFSSKVTAAATGFDSATHTGQTKIAALAEGIISISSVTRANPGDEIDYTVTAVNGGPSTMVDPVATITLPEGVTIVDLPENCNQSGNTLTCTLGDSLDPEAEYSFVFVAGLPDEVGDFQVIATLSSSTPLAETSSLDNDHVVVTDLVVEDGALPYTGSNSTMLALVGGALALGGLILVRATGTVARRRND